MRAAPDAHGDCAETPVGTHCALTGFTCTPIGACGVGAMRIAAPQALQSRDLTNDFAVDARAGAPTRTIAPEVPPPRA